MFGSVGSRFCLINFVSIVQYVQFCYIFSHVLDVPSSIKSIPLINIFRGWCSTKIGQRVVTFDFIYLEIESCRATLPYQSYCSICGCLQDERKKWCSTHVRVYPWTRYACVQKSKEPNGSTCDNQTDKAKLKNRINKPHRLTCSKLLISRELGAKN